MWPSGNRRRRCEMRFPLPSFKQVSDDIRAARLHHLTCSRRSPFPALARADHPRTWIVNSTRRDSPMIRRGFVMIVPLLVIAIGHVAARIDGERWATWWWVPVMVTYWLLLAGLTGANSDRRRLGE